jgi:hypothetical protein
MKFNPGGLLQHQVINDSSAKGSDPVSDRIVGREDSFNLVSRKAINNGRHSRRLRGESVIEVVEIVRGDSCLLKHDIIDHDGCDYG